MAEFLREQWDFRLVSVGSGVVLSLSPLASIITCGSSIS